MPVGVPVLIADPPISVIGSSVDELTKAVPLSVLFLDIVAVANELP